MRPKRRSARPREDPRQSLPPSRLALSQIPERLAQIDPSLAVSPAPAPVSQPLAALRDRDPAKRERAAKALGQEPAPGAADALRACLADPERPVRAAAALSLLRLGDPRLFRETLRDLADSAPRKVASAAHALGLSGNPQAVEPLLEAFKTHDTAVGAAVAAALGLLGDRRACPALQAALKVDFVPAEVCAALGRLGHPPSIPALARALCHREPDVRASAARALGHFRSRASEAEVGPKLAKAVPLLRKSLDDGLPRVRLLAALALFELGDAEARSRVLAELCQAGKGKAGQLTAKKAHG
jgi:HEAT repeat protein